MKCDVLINDCSHTAQPTPTIVSWAGPMIRSGMRTIIANPPTHMKSMVGDRIEASRAPDLADIRRIN
jgi:hypothetical protein